MGTQKRISFCPHCGNVAPQRLVHQHTTQAKEIDSAGNVTPTSEENYYLALCETCDEPLLYYWDPGMTEEDDLTEGLTYFQDGRLLWPRHGTPEGLPESVRTCYLEALRIKPVSPNAFAVQIRRALEAMCDDQGAARGPLAKRLKDLSFRREIPPKLVQITDVVRVLGNAGAHDYETNLSPADARVIDQFFRSIVEYVYVAPHALNTFKTMARLFGKQTAEEGQVQDEAEEARDSTKTPIN